MDINSKIYIAGHTGMVGSSIVRKLLKGGYNNLLFRESNELNLLNQNDVIEFFNREKPEYVFLAAGKVGGILANNSFRGQFLFENLSIQNNVIHSSHIFGVKKLLFLGSACIYPRNCTQPIKEEYLLSDYLESTNEPYAIAKISGIKLCENYFSQYGENFISVMPNNLYGPNDNFDLETSHVLPALLRKFHEAKENNHNSVEIWGSGNPKREFIFVDDLADACLFLMNNLDAKELYNEKISHINIGSGIEITIKNLSLLIMDIVGFEGDLVFNTNYPDGTPRKLLDNSRLNKMGYKINTSLSDGLRITYEWFKNQNY